MEMSYKKRILILGILVLSVVIGYTAYAYPKNDDSEYCTGNKETLYRYEGVGICVGQNEDNTISITPEREYGFPAEFIENILIENNAETKKSPII